jgi:hypothetical protein
MNLAIYFLALIGLIVVLIIIYRFSSVSMNKIDKSKIVKNWPPKQYMENVGVLCPDYWVYMGTDPNNPHKHVCMNRYNLDINETNLNKCYTNKNARQTSFTTMSVSQDKLLDKGKSTQDGLKDICSFIKDCGPSDSREASWLGINTTNGWAICS